MSVTALNKQISTVLNDLHLETREVPQLLDAVKPKVSNIEAKTLGDLYDRVTTVPNPPPGVVICFPTSAETGAVKALDAFFAAKGLPLGKNEQVMKDAIGDVLARVRLGVPMPRAPKTKSLIALDVNGQNVFVDVAKQRFYVKHGDNFFGPLSIPKSAPAPQQPETLSEGRKEKILRRLESLERAGRIGWTSGIPDFARGTKIYSEHLKGSNAGPGGREYTVMMSLGVELPGMPRELANPNEVMSMYIIRRDGRGPTQFATLTLDPRDV